MSDEPEKIPSPFDRFPGEFIESAVVDDSGEEVRMLGYGVGSDLAVHYDTIEIILSVLLREVPEDPRIMEAFSTAMTFAMPVTIADAAVHAARVARHLATISANDATVVSTAAIAVTELSRYQVEGLLPFIGWLNDKNGAFPTCANSESARETAMVNALRSRLPVDFVDPAVFSGDPGIVAAVLAVMHTCGLKHPHQMITALTTVRIPVAVAEAYAVSDPRIWKYPLNLPEWQYRPEDHDEA